MPRYAPNKMPVDVKRRYFELIREGWSGAAAANQVGVSLSCGSLWFIDAGRVSFAETAISPRYLSQDDRIEIADGLGRSEPVKQIAARIGKSFQTIYREIARNRKDDGRYQPWFAHNQAHLRRRRAKLRPVRRGRRAARGGGRQAHQTLVPGADQPLAAATLPPPQWMACVH
jgi:transposase, IS30 family